jgi:hypothetical protein
MGKTNFRDDVASIQSKYENEVSWIKRKTNKYIVYRWLLVKALDFIADVANKYYPGLLYSWMIAGRSKQRLYVINGYTEWVKLKEKYGWSFETMEEAIEVIESQCKNRTEG